MKVKFTQDDCFLVSIMRGEDGIGEEMELGLVQYCFIMLAEWMANKAQHILIEELNEQGKNRYY